MARLSREEINSISLLVVTSAIIVHREMGPGLLESVYHHCMIHELSLHSLKVSSKVPVPLMYKEVELKKDYVIDLLVEDAIILEIKAVEGLMPVHEAQLLSYLKLTNRRLGLLINFNVPLLKQGLKRMVNNL